MSDAIPSSSELLNTLRQFLEQEITPQVNARSAYMLKIASNLLQVLDRENQMGPEAMAAEIASLQALLGHTDSAVGIGSIESSNCTEKAQTLRRELCHRIQTGNMNLQDPALWQYLLATTQSQLNIDNPRYQFAPEVF